MKHSELINSERPYDPKHPPMSIHNRAAQFAPFDALNGFGSRIREVDRQTGNRIELTEEEMEEINRKLRILDASVKEHPIVTVTFFVPDGRKMGGIYRTLSEHVTKLLIHEERLILEGDIRIPFEDILEITIEHSIFVRL